MAVLLALEQSRSSVLKKIQISYGNTCVDENTKRS